MGDNIKITIQGESSELDELTEYLRRAKVPVMTCYTKEETAEMKNLMMDVAFSLAAQIIIVAGKEAVESTRKWYKDRKKNKKRAAKLHITFDNKVMELNEETLNLLKARVEGSSKKRKQPGKPASKSAPAHKASAS